MSDTDFDPQPTTNLLNKWRRESMTQDKPDTLADELEAAIEAWHDSFPSGQGESARPDSTDKFNAMAKLFYENSDLILAALRALAEPRSVLVEELEGCPRATYGIVGTKGYRMVPNELCDRILAALRTQPPVDATAEGEIERLREALDNFVYSLTSDGKNRDNMLTIDHAALMVAVDAARAALSASQADTPHDNHSQEAGRGQ